MLPAMLLGLAAGVRTAAFDYVALALARIYLVLALGHRAVDVHYRTSGHYAYLARAPGIGLCRLKFIADAGISPANGRETYPVIWDHASVG